MNISLENLHAAWRQFAGRLGRGRDTGPITNTDELRRFVATRAAFVSQKSLYGYLRTRMGTRYPAMFEDDVFVGSVNIAKMHVYAACLSDLATYAVACAAGGQVDAAGCRRLALACFDTGLADNADQVTDGFDPAAARAELVGRLADADWQTAAAQPQNFVASPQALVRWAPIAPELKRHDVEFVENSIRFAWREVRAELRKRLDSEAVAADLAARPAAEVAADTR